MVNGPRLLAEVGFLPYHLKIQLQIQSKQPHILAIKPISLQQVALR